MVKERKKRGSHNLRTVADNGSEKKKSNKVSAIKTASAFDILIFSEIVDNNDLVFKMC